MKKWIFIGFGAIVVIIIAVLLVGVWKLGPIIKTAVNTYGPQFTKTEVRLNDVGISILSAEVKLKDFLLGNPILRIFSTPCLARHCCVNAHERVERGNGPI